MAVTKEIVDRIVNFYPGNTDEVLSANEIHLGRVDDKEIFYGKFPFRQRVQQLNGEPLTPKWTKQPIVALIKGEQVVTLAYAADVRSLEDSLAEAVAEKIKLWNNSTWPEDY